MMRIILGPILMACFIAAMCRCSAPGSGLMPADADAALERNAGVTLLYQLLSDEARLDSILLLKSATDATSQLLREIDSSTSRMRDELAALFPSEQRSHTGLPRDETRARALIKAETTTRLLRADSDQFEDRILMVQAEALTYAAHLAEAVAESMPEGQRRAAIETMSTRLFELRSKVRSALAAGA